MSLVAITQNPNAANQALEAQGFGPNNFSVVCYSEGGASHAALHAWHDPAFAEAVKALPGVVYDESEGDPVARTQALIESQGAWWGAHIPALPDTGTIDAGDMYHYGETLYQVLVTHSRDTWSGDPAQWPTYIRRIRKPGEVREWEPVIDRYDSYWLVNPFTGQPDECLFDGEHYVVDAGNAEGGNTWPPAGAGSFGWVLKNPPIPDEWPEFVQPMAGDPGYMTGDKVTFGGKRYICNRDAVMHSPAAWPAAWDEQP